MRMTAGLPKPIIKIVEKFPINLLAELLFEESSSVFYYKVITINEEKI
ncbi:hypothetical protein ES705_39168 [subsurface metagenome]